MRKIYRGRRCMDRTQKITPPQECFKLFIRLDCKECCDDWKSCLVNEVTSLSVSIDSEKTGQPIKVFNKYYFGLEPNNYYCSGKYYRQTICFEEPEWGIKPEKVPSGYYEVSVHIGLGGYKEALEKFGGGLVEYNTRVYFVNDPPVIDIPEKMFHVKVGEKFKLDLRKYIEDDRSKYPEIKYCVAGDGCYYRSEITISSDEPKEKTIRIIATDDAGQKTEETIKVIFFEEESKEKYGENKLQKDTEEKINNKLPREKTTTTTLEYTYEALHRSSTDTSLYPQFSTIFALLLFTPFIIIPILINLAILWWVYKDAKKRYPPDDNMPIIWVIVCFFGGIIGLVLYLLLRPKT